MADLSPCPFCGKRLERNDAFSTRGQTHYMHPLLEDDVEPCIIEYIHVVEYQDTSRNHGVLNPDGWNRRTPSPQSREETH
ncbi:hypothetical protein CYG48_12680 [Neorhizobium sp. SOG26]|uniref:hypothetical protein n=1 Tax=Neorhizobium sp. SOG26 TaxID=2060726 RepID=UPI000E569863|nr:hypothetical protein [Neorhizobium sp. SOG26]AXV16466.1 hypothetical protein CYG48_12680 [Neorhizobium sp. SOG26]